jgi:exodeoxyribonuclease VII large subunit
LLAQPILQEADRLREELRTVIGERIRSIRHRHELLAKELDACSPYGVLERGYAVVRDNSGRVIKDAADVRAGDRIDIRLREGEIAAIAEETRKQ